MNFILKIIRSVLGSFILLFNVLIPPSKIDQRTESEQNQIDLLTKNLKLYQFVSCPFCVKVRRAMHRLRMKIETKDVLNDPVAEKELLAGGGERQVPCLRIEESSGVRWMYESDAIIAYLENLGKKTY